jgi:hypothetical protein
MMIYENTAGVLSLGDEGNYLRIDWKQGIRDDADIQAIFEKAREAGKELQWYKLLVNQQVMLSPSVWAEAWFIHEWLPSLSKHGITSGRCAVIVGRDVVTRSTTLGYLEEVETTESRFQVQQFLLEREAIEWLLKAD